MAPHLEALLLGLLAGLMIPVGAAFARIERLRPRWLEEEFRHSVMAFGGGVLIAAVALVLVPEGTRHLPAPAAIGALLAGGLAFAVLDRHKRPGAGSRAQFLAMLADFIPEALALGAMLAGDAPSAILLAVLIGLQNLPEGFNAFREQRETSSRSDAELLALFFVLALIGPAAVLAGEVFLAPLPELTAAIMLFAAGGILFLMFQDIAPKVPLENRIAPSMSAVGGFAFGLMAEMLVR